MSPLKHLSFQLILSLAAFNRSESANEYYTARLSRCLYSAPDFSDMVLIDNFYFNKFLFVQFNSTMKKFVGFNEYGIGFAEIWNNNTYVELEQTRIDTECKYNIKPREHNTHKVVKPKIKLRLEKQVGGKNPTVGRNPAVFMCSAYEFYPKDIKISWLKDGKVVTSDVTSVMEMADGDWYYQIHSQLEYSPKSGETISCMVEHASFTKPMIYDWDPGFPEAEMIQFIIGGCALALGIIVLTAGFICYQKKLMEKRGGTEILDTTASSTPRSGSPLSIAVTCNL